MDDKISFKERVRLTAIKESKSFKSIFVDKEFLICSHSFKKRDYYILSAEKDNYLHLVGIGTQLSALDFLINAMMVLFLLMILTLIKTDKMKVV